MILLPPADLDQDEATFRILAHLQSFQETADSLLNSVSLRTEKLHATYQGLDSRLKRIQWKLSFLRQLKRLTGLGYFDRSWQRFQRIENRYSMNTSGVLNCLSRFPAFDCRPVEDLSPPLLEREKVIFKPNAKSERVVDLRRELDKRKQFTPPSQLMRTKERVYRKERKVPSRINTFADMFYWGTDELAFGKKSSKRINFANHGRSLSQLANNPTNSFKQKLVQSFLQCNAFVTDPVVAAVLVVLILIADIDIVEASAILKLQQLDRGKDRDPLDYVLELDPREGLDDMNLPNILPDLPGIAEDLLIFDCGAMSTIPPDSSFTAEVKEDLYGTNERTESSTDTLGMADVTTFTRLSHSTNDISKAGLVEENKDVTGGLCAVSEGTSCFQNVSSPTVTTIPAHIPIAPLQSSSSSPPHPPVPPPPPPDPNLSMKVVSSSSSATLERSDLMAAIRAAGGAGKAKLKSVSSSTRRAAKECEPMGSSALSKNESLSGNDLMVSLAKALEARRKAISGLNDHEHKSSGRESISIGKEDSHAAHGDGDSFGDDDWK